MGDGTSVVSYGVVDRMLEPGPAVSLSGAVTGMFGTEPKDSPVTGELRMLHAFRVPLSPLAFGRRAHVMRAQIRARDGETEIRARATRWRATAPCGAGS